MKDILPLKPKNYKIMTDISCPHCGKAFKADETRDADILKKTRHKECDA